MKANISPGTIVKSFDVKFGLPEAYGMVIKVTKSGLIQVKFPELRDTISLKASVLTVIELPNIKTVYRQKSASYEIEEVQIIDTGNKWLWTKDCSRIADYERQKLFSDVAILKWKMYSDICERIEMYKKELKFLETQKSKFTKEST